MALAVGLSVGAGGVTVDGSGVTVKAGDAGGDGLEEAVGEGSGVCDGARSSSAAALPSGWRA